MNLSTGMKLALKQLRNASNNLSIEASDATISEEARDMLRSARLLTDQLANAIEKGETCTIASRAQEFDAYNALVTRS